MLKEYNKCIFCSSKKLKKEIKQKFKLNFYLEAIRSDLDLNKDFFRKIKIYKCQNCKILQNNPWFSENYIRKIYSNIYGQHNRGWSNLLNFINKKELPNHGTIYNILSDNFNIKTYAEFNNPFTGLFINFFNNEYKNKNHEKLFTNTINYLRSRQVVDKKFLIKKNSITQGKKFLNFINNFKKKNKNQKCKKYLFVDNSILTWGQNDNFKSVNSKSFASEFFDLEIIDINNFQQNKKIDIFGIFHTLDHTLEPKKILELALRISKVVVVYAHVDENLNKQHLFSLTPDFLKYLKNKKIFSLNLTKKINKKYSSPELYFVCSKNKKYINLLSKFI